MSPNFIDQTRYDENFKKNSLMPPASITINALDRAWQCRNFEIELYWKRAVYFWAFIASVFTAYIAVKTKLPSPNQNTVSNLNLEYLLLCLGAVLSLIWVFVNQASKVWQENWEKHIDLLEDDITGPLYKTVLYEKSHSISDLNLYVSITITCTWLFLIVQHWVNDWHKYTTCSPSTIWPLIITLGAIILMGKIYGGKKHTNEKYSRPSIEKPEMTKRFWTL